MAAGTFATPLASFTSSSSLVPQEVAGISRYRNKFCFLSHCPASSDWKASCRLHLGRWKEQEQGSSQSLFYCSCFRTEMSPRNIHSCSEQWILFLQTRFAKLCLKLLLQMKPPSCHPFWKQRPQIPKYRFKARFSELLSTYSPLGRPSSHAYHHSIWASSSNTLSTVMNICHIYSDPLPRGETWVGECFGCFIITHTQLCLW